MFGFCLRVNNEALPSPHRDLSLLTHSLISTRDPTQDLVAAKIEFNNISERVEPPG